MSTSNKKNHKKLSSPFMHYFNLKKNKIAENQLQDRIGQPLGAACLLAHVFVAFLSILHPQFEKDIRHFQW